MKTKRKKEVLVICFFVFLVLISSLNAQESNLTQGEQAKKCLEESRDIISSLHEKGFNVQRVSDLLNETEEIYNSKQILEKKGRVPDYSTVLQGCKEIENIKENAFKARDEFEALKKFYEDFITEEMNSSSVDGIMNKIQNEIDSERYENVPPLIDKGYKEITNVRSYYTTLNVFYKSTTAGFKKYIIDKLYYILGVIAVLVGGFLIFKNRVLKKIAKIKLERLNLRKSTIRDLIAKTQKNYFDKGNIPEEVYYIRISKYSELLRDIDRQIPLLEKRIAKYSKEKNYVSKFKYQIKGSNKKKTKKKKNKSLFNNLRFWDNGCKKTKKK